MRAAVFTRPGERLEIRDVARPEPGPGELLLRVRACGVCRTDLHLLDGEVAIAAPPRILGHQIVAEVAGDEARRVGVPWLGWTCGECRYCRAGRENLCVRARFTGRDIDGGFADYAVADERFCLPLPDGFEDAEVAPLLCAGLIGYRAYRMCGDPEALGLYGFGAAAHILCQIAVAEGRRVHAFTRTGDDASRALGLGASWAGSSEDTAPEPLDAAIIFAPVGPLVPAALAAVRPGGIVVCGGIHMSEIPAMPYSLLWEERTLRSVANLTRDDGRELLELAARIPVRTAVTTYPLERTQEALDDLREGRFAGSAVILP